MADRISYWTFRLQSSLRWYARAQTRYDVHSPYLHDFVREVYRDRRFYHAFGLIRNIRVAWSKSPDRVKLLELGAPSRTTNATSRSAASLVASNAIAESEGRMLFRLVLWLQPERIVEFGTNAGISTLYLHLADTRTPLFTVEGNPEVAALARASFERAGASERLQACVSTFRDWLRKPPFTGRARTLFFLDGDHRREPTVAYVRAMLPTATPDSIFVIADIHWSEEMEAAWEELKGLPEVRASVDTYHFGLLFFRTEMNGPHLTLTPTRSKPWRVGFF